MKWTNTLPVFKKKKVEGKRNPLLIFCACVPFCSFGSSQIIALYYFFLTKKKGKNKKKKKRTIIDPILLRHITPPPKRATFHTSRQRYPDRPEKEMMSYAHNCVAPFYRSKQKTYFGCEGVQILDFLGCCVPVCVRSLDPHISFIIIIKPR